MCYKRNRLLLVSSALSAALIAMPLQAQGVKDMRKVSPSELMPPIAEQVETQLETPPFVDNYNDEIASYTAVEENEDFSEAEIDPDYAAVAQPAAAEVKKPEPVVLQQDIKVSVMPATNISLDTIGLYNEKSGGVAADAWKGSTHNRVRELLTHMPQNIPSDALRSLVARLLLSSTQPPQSDNIQQNLFRQRIETLMHIDEVEQALRLVEMVPQSSLTEAITHVRYTAHLLKGDSEWICENVKNALKNYTNEAAYWQKLSIFCNALAKDSAKVQLSLDLLSEQNIKVNEGFAPLVQHMSGYSDKLSQRFTAPLSLDDGAMIAISGKDAFPKDYLESAPYAVARLVQNNSQFSKTVRDQATARLKTAFAQETPDAKHTKIHKAFTDKLALTPSKAFNFERAIQDTKSMGGLDDVQLSRLSYRYYNLLHALGFKTISEGSIWDMPSISSPGLTTVSPALHAELRAAVDAEKMGEAVVLSAIILGQSTTLAVLDDASVQSVVKALYQLGFTQ